MSATPSIRRQYEASSIAFANGTAVGILPLGGMGLFGLIVPAAMNGLTATFQVFDSVAGSWISTGVTQVLATGYWAAFVDSNAIALSAQPNPNQFIGQRRIRLCSAVLQQGLTSMATVVVELTSDEAKLLRGMQKVVDAQKKLEDGFKNPKKESDKLGDSIESMAMKAIGLGAAYAGVTTAVAAVNQALEDQVKLQQHSLDIALNLARSQQEAAKNLTGLTSAEIKRTLSIEAPKIAMDQGFADLGKITDALGAAYSASGDLAASINAVRAAAEVTRLTPDQLAGTAGQALDIRKASGLEDAEANLGFLLGVGKFARVEDPARVGRSVAPVLAAGVTTVPTQSGSQASVEAAAIFTALNQGSSDPMGEASQTAAITFIQKLSELFEGKEDPGTIAGRLRAVQQSDALRAELFDKPFGEARFKSQFQELARPGSRVSKDFEDAAEEVKFSATVFRDKAQETATLTPALTIATAKERAAAAVNVSEAVDTRSQARAQINNILNEALRTTEQGGFFNTLGSTFEYLHDWIPGFGSSESRSTTLSNKEFIESRLSSLGFRRGALLSSRTDDNAETIDAKLQAITVATQQIEKLAEILTKNTQATAAAQEKVTRSVENQAAQKRAGGAGIP